MLASIAIAPGVLSEPALADVAHRKALFSLLRGISGNGVIVTPSIEHLGASFGRLATAATSPSDQRLQGLATEWTKRENLKRIAIAVPNAAHCPLRCESSAECAKWGKVDGVVYSNQDDEAMLRKAGVADDLLIPIARFGYDSPFDDPSSDWHLHPRRLDTLPLRDAQRIVGRIIKFSGEVVVADKMVGLSAGGKPTAVNKFLTGVLFLANAWVRESPLSGACRLKVTLVTVAGMRGAKGFVPPETARKTIEIAMSGLDHGERVQLVLQLKEDPSPFTFNARFLKSQRRVWGLEHGIDFLGSLGTPGAQPTLLDIPSDDRDSMLRDVLALKAAE